jgi:predicted nucleotidyltransferase
LGLEEDDVRLRIENVYIYIEDMPVQFLPSYVSPLWQSAIEEAHVIDFEGIKSKFVSLEYLILLLLTSFRPKDRLRIGNLLGKANKRLLISLMRRYDDEKKLLYDRYKKILASAKEI